MGTIAADHDPRSWVLRFKYNVPRLPSRNVVRERLLQRLKAIATLPVTFLIAPAGFGKSVLLANLHATIDRSTTAAAWLTLDPDDNNPANLLQGLLAAFLEAQVPVGSAAEPSSSWLADSSLKNQLAAMLWHVDAADRNTLLIIDDVDKIHDPASLDLLDALIGGAPPGLHILIAGRSRPPLHTGALRVRSQSAEVELDELRFTVEEAGSLLGEDYPREQTEALVRRTEGWAAALELARHWIRRQKDPVEAIGDLGAGSPELIRFFAEEILAGLRPEVAEFLSIVSIADHICADLAHALSGRDDSGRILEALAQDNLLLVPLDAAGRWYKHHRLMLDFLRQRLRRDRAADVGVLHRRAAAWFAGEKLFHEAVRHSMLGGDPAGALRIGERAGGWIAVLEKGLPMLGLLRELDCSDVRAYPRVRLGQIFLLLLERRIPEARAALEAMRTATRDFTDVATEYGVCIEGHSMDQLLSFFEDRAMNPDALARLALQQPPGTGAGAFASGLAQMLISLGYLDRGELEQCRVFGMRSLTFCQNFDAGYAESLLRVDMGLADLQQGYLAQAQVQFERVYESAIERAGEDNIEAAMANVVLAELHYERNEVDPARQLILHATPWLRRPTGWLDYYASGYSTLASLASLDGRHDEVDRILEQSEAIATERGFGRLTALVRARRVRELVRRDRLDEADRAWTTLASHHTVDVESVDIRDLRVVSAICLSRARLLIAMRQLQPALSLLGQVHKRAVATARHRLLLETRLLRAACLYKIDRVDEAISELSSAMPFAARERYSRTVLDDAELLRGVIDSALGADAPEYRYLIALRDALSTDREMAGGVDAPTCGLSPRERQVLQCLSDGLSNKEIARRLGVSEGTVKIYRRNLYRKVNVHSRSGLVARGRALGLLSTA